MANIGCFSNSLKRYTLLEKVQLRPYSVISYSYVHDAERDYEVGYKETLKQNIHKEKTELEKLNEIDDLTEFGGINGYVKKYEQLYKEKQQVTYNEKGITLKELGTLSHSQIKNVKRITSLFADSTSRNKERYLAFLTLTLPSKQMHHDRVFRKLLAKFLDHLKKTVKLENYVWKAETQKNGNIHFHLLIDRFIDKDYIQQKWNGYLNKLGYIDTYSDKMQKMSPKEYIKNYKKYYKMEKDCLNAYMRGKKSGWKNPNTTKIETPRKQSTIYAYLVKYFYKKEDDKRAIIGALWGASNKVKKIKYPELFMSQCFEEYHNIIQRLEKIPVNNFVELFSGKVYQLVRKGYRIFNRCLKMTERGITRYLTSDADLGFYDAVYQEIKPINI